MWIVRHRALVDVRHGDAPAPTAALVAIPVLDAAPTTTCRRGIAPPPPHAAVILVLHEFSFGATCLMTAWYVNLKTVTRPPSVSGAIISRAAIISILSTFRDIVWAPCFVAIEYRYQSIFARVCRI